METSLRISVQGRGNLERVFQNAPHIAEGVMKVQAKLAKPDALGVCIVSRLPGDMGLRLGDLVAGFLSIEHQEGRLPL